MNTYYLRLEAVNLSYFLEDCQDLSTIRGGGLILLDSPGRVQNAFPALTPVSSGASQALYSFQATGPSAAATVRDNVAGYLSEDDQTRHATFVVDIVPAEDYALSREKTVALNRFRQMRSRTVAWPRESSPLVCQYDGLRPATQRSIKGNDDIKDVSESVFQRREYGKNLKNSLYRRVNEPRFRHAKGFPRELTLPKFTREFEELAKHPGKGSLDGKMAVIHVDGNRFGPRQIQYCPSGQKQQEFDDAVQHGRLFWLRQHLESTLTDLDWFDEEHRYRMEVLLWGGDEIVVVVPAWKGWATLEGYFAKTADMNFNGPLTHGAGVVFCSHKAPIHSIVSLAKRLTEEAKHKELQGGDGQNLFCYQVLESFDTLGSGVEKLRDEHYGVLKRRVLEASVMTNVSNVLPNVKKIFPRRKLHAIVRDGAGEANREVQDAIKRLGDDWPLLTKALAGLDPDSPNHWKHLNELWDYIV